MVMVMLVVVGCVCCVCEGVWRGGVGLGGGGTRAAGERYGVARSRNAAADGRRQRALRAAAHIWRRRRPWRRPAWALTRGWCSACQSFGVCPWSSRLAWGREREGRARGESAGWRRCSASARRLIPVQACTRPALTVQRELHLEGRPRARLSATAGPSAGARRRAFQGLVAHGGQLGAHLCAAGNALLADGFPALGHKGRDLGGGA